VGEEWRVGSGYLEVRRGIFGLGSGRRYSNGLLWIEAELSRAGVRRSLVLQSAGERRLLAVGDEARLRALGDLIARQTGWRLRISPIAPARHTSLALLPLPAFFLLAGLLAAWIGYRLPHREATLVRHLSPVKAGDLPVPGTPALAYGSIGPADTEQPHGMAVYDVSVPRVSSRHGRSWEPLTLSHDPFRLYQREGAISIVSGPAELIETRRKVIVSGRRFTGFRAGDRVTVLANVVDEGGHRSLAARAIYGGTPAEYARQLDRQALALSGMGLLAALAGALFLRALLRARSLGAV
jgi:hypothetical protein